MLRSILAIGLVMTAGCFSTGTAKEGQKELPAATPARRALGDFGLYFATRIESAADDAMAKIPDVATRRKAVLWKMLVIPQCRAAMDLADDQAAYLNTWILCTRMVQFFEEGAGKGSLGDATPIALAACKEIEGRIESLGPMFLTKEQLASAKNEVSEFARRVPFGEDFKLPEGKSTWTSTTSSLLGKTLSVVQMPFSAVNPVGGISDTAVAAYRVAGTIDRTRTDIGFLPTKVRWNTELLLLELEQNESVKSALASIETIGNSSASLADTAARLPEDVSKVITDLDEKQAGLQATLAEARATLESADAALTRADAVVASADTTAQSLARMGESWTGMFQAFDEVVAGLTPEPAEEVPPEEKGRPFDITEYERTAVELTKTADALNALLLELQAVTGEDRADALLATTRAAVGATVDRVLLSAALFLLFFFALLLGYRRLASRIA